MDKIHSQNTSSGPGSRAALSAHPPRSTQGVRSSSGGSQGSIWLVQQRWSHLTNREPPAHLDASPGKGRMWGWAGSRLLGPGAGSSTLAAHPGLKKATPRCVHRPANIHTPGWDGVIAPPLNDGDLRASLDTSLLRLRAGTTAFTLSLRCTCRAHLWVRGTATLQSL